MSISPAWAAGIEAAEECYSAVSPEILLRMERDGGPHQYIKFVVENVMRDVVGGEYPFPGVPTEESLRDFGHALAMRLDELFDGEPPEEGLEMSRYAGGYPTEFSRGVAEADSTWPNLKPEARKNPGRTGSEEGLLMVADMKSPYRYNRQVGGDENQHYAFLEGYVTRMQQLYREER